MKQKAELLFQKFVNLKLLPFSKADKAYIQYCNFIDDDMQLKGKYKTIQAWRVPYQQLLFSEDRVDIKSPDMSASLLLGKQK